MSGSLFSAAAFVNNEASPKNRRRMSMTAAFKPAFRLPLINLLEIVKAKIKNL